MSDQPPLWLIASSTVSQIPASRNDGERSKDTFPLCESWHDGGFLQNVVWSLAGLIVAGWLRLGLKVEEKVLGSWFDGNSPENKHPSHGSVTLESSQ